VEESGFTEFYKQTVKNALSRILGDNAAKSVLFHTGFEDRCSPSEFHQKLLSMLAEGAYTIERSIIEEMFARLCTESHHTDPDFDFESSLREARRIYAQRTGLA